MMKALVLHEHGGDVVVEDLHIPKLRESEVLLNMLACGLCHTDLHVINGDWEEKSMLPLIPGHEGIGEIIAFGSESIRKDYDLKIGDRVGVAWIYSTCLSCEYCTTGWSTLCPKIINTGFKVNGCLSEKFVAHINHLVKIPSTVNSLQAAPIMCAGVTTYKALKETDAKAGEFVAIIGASGGLGHLSIQYANAMGLRVIAYDVDEEKLAYCRSVGAEFTLNILHADVVKQTHSIVTDGCPAVLCLAPVLSAYQTSLQLCRRKGTVVCVGLPSGAVPVNVFEVAMRALTIKGSIVGTRQDIVEALDFVSRGLVTCDVHAARLTDFSAVLQSMKSGSIRGRVVFSMGSAAHSQALSPCCNCPSPCSCVPPCTCTKHADTAPEKHLLKNTGHVGEHRRL